MATRGNEWTALDTPSGFERCVRGSVRELYGYVALLTGRDRAKTEQLVTDVYRSLFRAATAGQLDAVRLSSLRSAGRRLWLERNDAELARPARLSPAPVKSIAELSVIERAVVVLRHVNGMSDERTGDELGRPPAEVAAVADHAVRRLRGTTDTSGTWLRAYFDASVSPRPGLVDRIVAELGPRDDTPAAAPVASADEPTAPFAVVDPDVDVDAGSDVASADVPTAPVAVVDADVDADAGSEVVSADEPTMPVAAIDADVDADVDADADPLVASAPAADAPTEQLPVVEPPSGRTPDVIAPDESAGDATDAIARSWRELSIAELGAGATAPRDDEVVGDSADLATAELPMAAGGDPARPSVAPVAADELPTAAPVERSAGRRWWPIALVGALAVVLFAVWWFARDDGAGSATTGGTLPAPIATSTTPTAATGGPTTVSAPSSGPTSVPSTVPATTVPAPTTVPVTAAAPLEPVALIDGEGSDRFDPACAAWYAQPTPASPALPTAFGPLGADPAVSVALPAVDGVGATVVEPAGDGLLVGLLQSDLDGTSSATLLARIGIDGVVHWVRCYDEPLIVVGEPNADLDAAVGRFVDGQLGWYRVSMADGDISREVEPVAAFALDVLYDRGPAEPTGATAQWVDGVLTGLDADGNVTWTDPEVSTLTGEGFVIAVGDDLAIAHLCDDEACERGRLRAYDLRTGDVVWEREGARNVAAVADGYALIGVSDAGWELVSSADGQTVPGQTWADPDLFATRCCGEGELWFAERIGGVVVAARPDAIDLWLPVDASGDTVAVDLAPPD